MLQYYQRPWMIGPILDALRSCDTVASEVVVNVDSTDEPQTWCDCCGSSRCCVSLAKLRQRL